MNRLQTIVLAVWSLSLILLAIFNTGAVFESRTLDFLFLSLEGPWLAWLLAGALGMPIVIHLVGRWERGRALKRAGSEIDRIKSAAFDNRGQEMEQWAERLSSRVEQLLSARLPAQPGDAAPREDSSRAESGPEPEPGETG